LRLEAFYTFNERFAKIRSKRIKQAVKGITGQRSSELASTDDLKDVPENPKRREVSSTGNRSKNKELMESSDCIDGETINSVKKLKSQQKRRYPKEVLTSDGGSTVLLSKAEERRLNSAGSSRVRGRRKAKAAQRGRRKDDPDSEVDETSIHISSSSATGSEHKDELQAKKVHLGDIVRRVYSASLFLNSFLVPACANGHLDHDHGILCSIMRQIGDLVGIKPENQLFVACVTYSNLLHYFWGP